MKIIRILRNIFIFLALIATVLLAGYLLKMQEENTAFSRIRKEAVEKIKRDKDLSGDKEQSVSQVDILLELQKQNSDLVGWIQIDDTMIDYPVMYTPEDKEYYLHRDFNEDYSFAGTVFIDGRCKLEPMSNNLIIYGHNMNAGTMFHDLVKFTNKDFYEDHREISFDTVYGEGVYKVVAVFYATANSKDAGYKYYNYTGSGKEGFDEYVSYIQERSIYEMDTQVMYGDQLITLSTCSHHVHNGRLAVVAKKM